MPVPCTSSRVGPGRDLGEIPGGPGGEAGAAAAVAKRASQRAEASPIGSGRCAIAFDRPRSPASLILMPPEKPTLAFRVARGSASTRAVRDFDCRRTWMRMTF